MRIAISGTACQGKSTLINDMLTEWPMYKKVESSYRKKIKENQLKHSKETTEEVQWNILNCLIDDLQANSDKTGYVIHDRCPLDNIVYSIWANAKNPNNISDEFIKKCIPLVRESMRHLDIIFFIPITRVSPVKVEPREDREADSEYIKEIDHIFKSILHQLIRTGVSVFFPKDDSPGVIEVFGAPLERIQLIRYYLNAYGDLIGGDGKDSLLTPDAIENLTKLIDEQKELKGMEDKEKDLYKKFVLGQ